MNSPQDDVEPAVTSQQEENKEPEMAYDPTQETYWDDAAFYQQSLSLGTNPLENSLLEQTPLGMTIDNSSTQYIQGLTGEPAGLSYPDWGGSIHGDILSGGDYSPGPSRLDNPSTLSERNIRNTAGPRRPSAEAIARRRKQNRVSQAAWRARNKELVEELRQEIAEHTEYNQTMQETMRALLKTTESLKNVIENALALPIPTGEKNTNPGEGQLLSPESSIDMIGFDLDAPHDP